ncbi:MAG: hypothetical protein GY938_20830 [Ketobacter sp.]|nr:hypothetical protein [Ketobacter sp.]
MENLDYWRLCEELNIVQAALLVVGEDPTIAEYAEDWEVQDRPKGYEAAKTAICSGLRNHIRYEKELNDIEAQDASLRVDHPNTTSLLYENDDYLNVLRSRSVSGILVEQREYDINGNPFGSIEGSVDVYKSLVNADSLKQWLRRKGFKTGFFFPEPVDTLDFLDPSNPRYAPKLAASVRAWQAVTNAGKRSPKQALDKWLREHAVEYSLTNNEGKPIEQAIEECSKVANWSPKGGATKTPS